MLLGLNTGDRGDHPGLGGEILQLASVYVPGVTGRDVLDTLPRGTRSMPHVFVMTVDVLLRRPLQDNQPYRVVVVTWISLSLVAQESARSPPDFDEPGYFAKRLVSRSQVGHVAPFVRSRALREWACHPWVSGAGRSKSTAG